MGQIVRYRCNCGYDKQLSVGGGMMANRESTVRGVFEDSELQIFNAAQKAKILKRFFMDYEPALCPECGVLIQSPVLRFWVGAREHVLRKPCPDCGGEIVPQDQGAVQCPQCGETLEAQSAGMWD